MRISISLLIFLLSLNTVIAAGAETPSSPRFAFGIEYGLTFKAYEMAPHYSEIGATWTKFNGPGTFWEDIEKKPPYKGIHSYSWSEVDQAIKAMQEAGFVNLTIVLGSRCSWGSRPLKGFLDRMLNKDSSTPPLKKYWKDYAAYVSAFVERYDADGIDDMPGLKTPVLHYEIMTEAQQDVYWQGTAKEYIEVLKTSYLAAKKANPETTIILSGFWFADMFDEGPLSDAQIEDKFANIPHQYPASDPRRVTAAGHRSHFEFNKQILKASDYFDAVEFHLLDNYTSIEGAVGWIRRQMRKTVIQNLYG